jgi:hypothetical protein
MKTSLPCLLVTVDACVHYCYDTIFNLYTLDSMVAQEIITLLVS